MVPFLSYSMRSLGYELYPIRTFLKRTLPDTNIFHNIFSRYEANTIRTFFLYEHLLRNSCLRIFCNTIFFPHELSRRNCLHTNFICYKLFEYRLYPIRTFNTTNFSRDELFLPYEHYPIRTPAYEHLLSNLFLYEPYVYELWSWKHSIRIYLMNQI